MKHNIHFKTLGGWGKHIGAFGYDLSGESMWKAATKTGVLRYGETGDARPLAPAFRTIFNAPWNLRASYSTLAGSNTYLVNKQAPFGGSAGITYTYSDVTTPHAFAINGALAANEAFAFRAFIHEVDGAGSDVKGHVWHVRLGSAGNGIVFQIRDGRPEIGYMSNNWTRAKENSLHTLWAISSPTPTDEQNIANLILDIYTKFESLSFDNTTGRDQWRGELVELALIPAPDGTVHLALGQGGAITAINLIDPYSVTSQVVLWSGAIEVGATGGAWIFQALQVRFVAYAVMEFGPFFEGPWSDSWGDVSYSIQAYSPGTNGGLPAGTVTFSRSEVGSASFKFTATFTTTDSRYGAWLYNVSSRIEGGVRTGYSYSTESFNTTAFPSNPTLDVQITMSESGRRDGLIVMRDPGGETSAEMAGGTFNGFNGRVCDVTHPDMGALFTQSLVKSARLKDARSYEGIYTLSSKGETVIECEIDDGQIGEETLCDPPPIGDGINLGLQFRRLHKMEGLADAEIALIPSGFGPVLEAARVNESWATVPDRDQSTQSAREALLDRYGLNIRHYKTGAGVWVLEYVPATIVAEFTSDASQNGISRDIILNPLQWERNNDEYYNKFTVIGGTEERPIARTWFDDYSLLLASGGVAHPKWLGRVKEYPPLRDTGLRTEGAVNYALRSLVYRYSKPGRWAQFETYFERTYNPRDRVTVDGILCEVEYWSASSAEDSMQIRVREVFDV